MSGGWAARAPSPRGRSALSVGEARTKAEASRARAFLRPMTGYDRSHHNWNLHLGGVVLHNSNANTAAVLCCHETLECPVSQSRQPCLSHSSLLGRSSLPQHRSTYIAPRKCADWERAHRLSPPCREAMQTPCTATRTLRSDRVSSWLALARHSWMLTPECPPFRPSTVTCMHFTSLTARAMALTEHPQNNRPGGAYQL